MSLMGQKTEVQVKKKLQQEKRQLPLVGGLALLLVHWKEGRPGCALLPFADHQLGTPEGLDS